MMPVLAFVPEDTVEEAFADAQPILDYFEDTSIGRPGRQNRE